MNLSHFFMDFKEMLWFFCHKNKRKKDVDTSSSEVPAIELRVCTISLYYFQHKIVKN